MVLVDHNDDEGFCIGFIRIQFQATNDVLLDALAIETIDKKLLLSKTKQMRVILFLIILQVRLVLWL